MHIEIEELRVRLDKSLYLNHEYDEHGEPQMTGDSEVVDTEMDELDDGKEVCRILDSLCLEEY